MNMENLQTADTKPRVSLTVLERAGHCPHIWKMHPLFLLNIKILVHSDSQEFLLPLLSVLHNPALKVGRRAALSLFIFGSFATFFVHVSDLLFPRELRTPNAHCSLAHWGLMRSSKSLHRSAESGIKVSRSFLPYLLRSLTFLLFRMKHLNFQQLFSTTAVTSDTVSSTYSPLMGYTLLHLHCPHR